MIRLGHFIMQVKSYVLKGLERIEKVRSFYASEKVCLKHLKRSGNVLRISMLNSLVYIDININSCYIIHH